MLKDLSEELEPLFSLAIIYDEKKRKQLNKIYIVNEGQRDRQK